MNAPALTHDESVTRLAMPLAAVFVVSLGYGVVLPVLPFVLVPALAYRVSLAAGSAQGAAFGKQTAAASLGQAVGSTAPGWLFAVLIEAPFWAAAGLLGLGAVAALRVSNTSKEVTYE